MTNPRTVCVNGIDWRFISVESHEGTIGFAYTFFNQDGYHTASHIKRIFRDTWDRSVLNRIDRWVMVTINAARADDATLISIIKKTMKDGDAPAARRTNN